MRLRTQLVLAFLMLAVVPLAGVSLYSYQASERAYRRAVEDEASAMAEEMKQRMARVSDDLDRRLARVGDLPFSALLEKGRGPQAEALLGRVQAEMGEAADLVDALEYVPQEPEKSRRSVVVAPKPPPDPEEAGGPAEGWEIRPPEPPEGADVPDPEDLAQVPPGLKEQIREQVRAAQEQARKQVVQARKHAAKARREARALEERNRKAALQLQRPFGSTVRKDGAAVGRLEAHLRSQQLLHTVLAPGGRRRDEIAFAVDGQGKVFTPDAANRAKAESLARAAGASAGADETRRTSDDWVIVTRKDAASGVTLGIARPVGEGLQEIRRTAVRNLAFGLGIVAIALLGILPLSSKMTRNLAMLSDGAERLAGGDLEARVPVRSADEFGRLAETFNRMAHELRRNQERLLEQERLRRELEMCRRIQEEMLPRHPMRFPFAEVKGISIPAREVGGDFFNYFSLQGGEAALLVGDVSGKGVPAALLMANLQATLRARLPFEGLALLAEHLDHEIDKETPLGAYLTLFMGIVDGQKGSLRYVNAGHNAPLVLSLDGALATLDSTGRPLGLYPGGGYEERQVTLRPGDTIFLYTDGLVEAEDEAGESFGVERLRALLVAERTQGAEAILAAVEEALRTHRGRAEALDDATLVALKLDGALAPGGSPGVG